MSRDIVPFRTFHHCRWEALKFLSPSIHIDGNWGYMKSRKIVTPVCSCHVKEQPWRCADQYAEENRDSVFQVA